MHLLLFLTAAISVNVVLGAKCDPDYDVSFNFCPVIAYFCYYYEPY